MAYPVATYTWVSIGQIAKRWDKCKLKGGGQKTLTGNPWPGPSSQFPVPSCFWSSTRRPTKALLASLLLRTKIPTGNERGQFSRGRSQLWCSQFRPLNHLHLTNTLLLDSDRLIERPTAEVIGKLVVRNYSRCPWRAYHSLNLNFHSSTYTSALQFWNVTVFDESRTDRWLIFIIDWTIIEIKLIYSGLLRTIYLQTCLITAKKPKN